MRSSIATYRESLSRLAGEVDDAAADEVPSPASSRAGEHAPTPPSSGRRRRYSRPGPAEPDEISKLKEDIQKLQASEAEIKALSFNYAAVLKEKEEQLGKLREENGSLKRSLESSNSKAISGNSNGTLERSSSRVQRNTVQENSVTVLKQNGYGGGASQGIQQNGLHSLTEHHKGDELEEERSYFAAKQASLENEIKQLKQQLRNDSNKENETKRRLEDENKRNEFLQQQLNELKVNRERLTTTMEELHKELREKNTELRRVQDELSMRDKEHISGGSLQSQRSMVMALQKENLDLKIEKGRLEADLMNMKSASQKVDDGTSDINNVSDVEKGGGCKFFTWFDPESSPFVRQLLLDLRDRVRSLCSENMKLREALSEAKADLEMGTSDRRVEMKAMKDALANKEEIMGRQKLIISKLENKRLMCMCVIGTVFAVLATCWLM